jgi:hypothetical protein
MECGMGHHVIYANHYVLTRVFGLDLSPGSLNVAVEEVV